MDVKATYVRVPLAKVQEHAAIPSLRDMASVIVTITCDNGLVGIGRTYGGDVFGSHAVKACVEHSYKPLLVGQDPSRIHAIWTQLEKASHFLGRSGVAFKALSAVDIALWDLLGKSVGQPLYRLLGGSRDAIPVYASEGWLTQGIEELVACQKELVRQGYRALKIRVPPEEKEAIARVDAVRSAVGDEVEIMLDVQNCWRDAATAIRRARALEPYKPFWIEEPVRVQDMDGHAKVAEAIDAAVAAGEHIYSKHHFREFLSARAVDIVQPDAVRCGGISEWMKVAALAESWFIPIAPHAAYEVHIHCAAAVSGVIYVEYLSDYEGELLPLLYRDFTGPVNGMGTPPDGPGLGIALNEENIREFEVKETV